MDRLHGGEGEREREREGNKRQVELDPAMVVVAVKRHLLLTTLLVVLS